RVHGVLDDVPCGIHRRAADHWITGIGDRCKRCHSECAGEQDRSQFTHVRSSLVYSPSGAGHTEIRSSRDRVSLLFKIKASQSFAFVKLILERSIAVIAGLYSST